MLAQILSSSSHNHVDVLDDGINGFHVHIFFSRTTLHSRHPAVFDVFIFSLQRFERIFSAQHLELLHDSVLRAYAFEPLPSLERVS
jgi:hypothetical protein